MDIYRTPLPPRQDVVCDECRCAFGPEEGQYETPIGVLCLPCYEDFIYAPDREQVAAAREMAKYYDEEGWERV